MASADQSISPFLDDLLQRNVRNSEHARRIAGHLTPAQLLWQPEPTAWGVGQCLEHLRISAVFYFDPMEASLARARAAGYNATPGHRPRHTLMGRMLIWAISPRTKLRTKNPKKISPVTVDAETVLLEFLATQDRLAAAMTAAVGVNLSKARMRSPMNALFHLNLADAFEVLVAHAERHLNQAERVTQHAAFPR